MFSRPVTPAWADGSRFHSNILCRRCLFNIAHSIGKIQYSKPSEMSNIGQPLRLDLVTVDSSWIARSASICWLNANG